jgi:hypothetical protein
MVAVINVWKTGNYTWRRKSLEVFEFRLQLYVRNFGSNENEAKF